MNNIPKLNPFGESVNFHHIGLAVINISHAHITGLQPKTDPKQGVVVAFADIGNCCIELIEPAGEDSPVMNSLKKNNKLHHICFEVDNIDAAIREARKSKFFPIAEQVPAVAFDNRKIAWIFSDVWGLFELLQRT